MYNNYIINESVVFHPTTSTLCDCKAPDHLIELNSPAARCLLLLIKRSGEVVNQQEFMDFVWKKSGMTVTPNAYYHNISVLRKGLKKIGLGDDIIVTIPRIGLTLAAGTRIRMIETEKSSTVNDDAHIVASSENKSHRVSEKKNHTANSNILSAPSSHSARSKWLLCFPLLIVFALILPTISVYLIFFFSQKDNYFSDFIPSLSTKECHILLSPLTFKGDGKESALNYAKEYVNDCQKLPWIYVTKIPSLPRASVIRCDKSFSQSSTCISAYFIE